ncbi:MAG: protein-export chaperone SecB [Alphaproteobacteria bacterium]|nr:protein-export chaperone SecB [Alphaproteobacteria bacterium]
MSNPTNSNNGQEGTMPMSPLIINGQYIKDLSFESPTPLESLSDNKELPEISVNVDIKANGVNNNTYEVALSITADAQRKSQDGDKKVLKRMFLIELEYAGIFTIGAVDQNAVHPLLMIECPRILFPSARSIIANITREAGFPALSLNPIDFAELYRQQFMKEQQGQAEVEAPKSDPKTDH